MTPTRREFIQSLGIALGSLVLTGCGSTPAPDVIIQCYVQVDPPRTPTPTPSRSHGRQKVRDCWLRLDWLAERAQVGAEEARLAKQELVNQHRAAVDELVAVGELSEDVARYVRVAFVAAADYAIDPQPEQAGVIVEETVIECYVQVDPPYVSPPTPRPPTERQVEEAARETALLYASGSGRRLAQQAELLEEMAATSDIDPETVTVVQAAIQKDMIVLSATDREALVAFLVAASGGTYHFPGVEHLEIDIPPEVAEAARFLVELILEE